MHLKMHARSKVLLQLSIEINVKDRGSLGFIYFLESLMEIRAMSSAVVS